MATVVAGSGDDDDSTVAQQKQLQNDNEFSGHF